MKKDTIFDGRFTILDFFKFLVLGYTAYATYTLVAGVSTVGAIGQYVRPLIAVAIVEGGLLFSEKLEAKAKNDEQAAAAQVAHLASIVLIVFLAVSSVIVELAGADMLSSQVRVFGFMAPLRQVGEGGAGIILALWIGFCLSVSLYYNAKDPDVIMAREKAKSDGLVGMERVKHYRLARTATAPTLGRAQAMQEFMPTMEGLDAETKSRILNDANNELDRHTQMNMLPPSQIQMRRGMVDNFDDGEGPILAEPPFVPANKIANDEDGEGAANFPERRGPRRVHLTSLPKKYNKFNPNI